MSHLFEYTSKDMLCFTLSFESFPNIKNQFKEKNSLLNPLFFIYFTHSKSCFLCCYNLKFFGIRLGWYEVVIVPTYIRNMSTFIQKSIIYQHPKMCRDDGQKELMVLKILHILKDWKISICFRWGKVAESWRHQMLENIPQ